MKDNNDDSLCPLVNQVLPALSNNRLAPSLRLFTSEYYRTPSPGNQLDLDASSFIDSSHTGSRWTQISYRISSQDDLVTPVNLHRHRSGDLSTITPYASSVDAQERRRVGPYRQPRGARLSRRRDAFRPWHRFRRCDIVSTAQTRDIPTEVACETCWQVERKCEVEVEVCPQAARSPSG